MKRLLFVFAVLAAVAPAVAAAPTAAPPAGQHLLTLIRRQFRSHRPPPPFETYTIERKQDTYQGFPDYAESYTYHVWMRTVDRASLKRQVFRDDYRGDLNFDRPAFNEARDPGPPTADVFEPAPLHPHPVEFVPTPEPIGTPIPLIGSVQAVTELDYHVDRVTNEGAQYHLILRPLRDPDRNRLRELWVDRKTLDLRKLVATDKLFVEHDKVYGVTFTVTFAMLQGIPVVTQAHGVVDPEYTGDGGTVDFFFRDIAFPPSLPGWYFDPHTYAAHRSDAPI